MLFVVSLNMQCQSVGLSLKECVTSGLTHVQSFSGFTRNLEKFWSAVRNFSAAQWVQFSDTGRQILTTGPGRQFFRSVHSYFRPWRSVL